MMDLIMSYHQKTEMHMFPTALMPLMMIVIPRATKKRVTVCCTHLKAKKGFEEVRLAQARHLLGVIEVPLPLPRSNLQDHHRHLNDHDGRPGGKMRAHNPRWRLQCWLGRTRLPAGKLVNGQNFNPCTGSLILGLVVLG